jgi:sugar/nucleoside kinase (ribokinase family)
MAVQMRSPRAIVLGEMCVDIVVHQPGGVPMFGHPTWANSIEVRLGGSATYVAQTLHAFGVDVQFNLPFGDDNLARQLVADLAASGMHIQGIHFVRGQSSMKAVIICSGDTHRFAACSTPTPYTERMIDLSLSQLDLVYFGGYALYPELWGPRLAEFFTQAKRNGAIILVDTQVLPVPSGQYIDRALQPEVFAQIDGLLLNEREAQVFSREADLQSAIQALGHLGPRFVVVKLGDQGSLAWESGQLHHIQAIKIEATDYIGAGDFFGAGLGYGLLQGWNLRRAAEFASATAAAGISLHCGAGAAPLTRAKVEAILQQRDASGI